MTNQSRRDFLKFAGLGLSTVAAQQLLTACGVKPSATQVPAAPTDPEFPQEATGSPTATQANLPDMVVTHGKEPETLIRQGIAALGGMERFMKPGANVIIKPNICVGYNTYEYATTTNPWVVSALVKMCLEAGAKQVRVMDNGFGGDARSCYLGSGIEEQVVAAGGVMEVMTNLKYADTDIPNAESLKTAKIYQDILSADFVINVPIAKNHSMATLTLGLKNLMGTIQQRERIHPSFEHNLVDLATVIRPHLTIVDAIRTLMDNGPTGGDLNDVKEQDTIIFSPDIVAADAYATRLFGMTPQDIPYIMAAGERGLGKTDLSGLKIEEFNVAA